MRVRVRMYRQGLGDCFLLSFEEDGQARHALIDCGTLGATTTAVRMREVAEDIRAATGGHLDLLVATHEHKDHLSGFRDQRAIFDQIQVDHVWLAWTEDADDELALQLEKHSGDLLHASQLAAQALLDERADPGPQRDLAREVGQGARDLLGFAADDEMLGAGLATTVNEAMDWVTRKAPVEFLSPGTPALEPSWLPGVRVYVLGPPRDLTAIAQLGNHGSPELYKLASRARDLAAGVEFALAHQSLANYASGRSADEKQELSLLMPFDPRHRLEVSQPAVRERFAAYYDEERSWQRIDWDWLLGASELALQLDNQTNNGSLALAFEIIADGRVLLFPADAQVGNWVSWHRPEMHWQVPDAAGGQGDVTARDLLSRVVLYKVGHHSSHNATVRELGLELMTSPDLVAMIPVDRAVAMNKHPPWRMPARPLYRRLIEKAQGRVVRSDVGWPTATDAEFGDMFTAAEWAVWTQRQQAASVVVEELFVDWTSGQA